LTSRSTRDQVLELKSGIVDIALRRFVIRFCFFEELVRGLHRLKSGSGHVQI
jgi:hypothetical protein